MEVGNVRDLIERCRNGDEDAIATMVRRYRTKALDLAAALLGDEHLAQDAVQEAFLAALGNLSSLRDPNAFAGWFRQIVRTQCHRILRRRREQPVDAIDRVASGVSPSEQIERDERRSLVLRALAALPPGGRRAAAMFYLEERQCAEIGAELNLPVSTVKRRLHDARRRLREVLLGQIPDAEREDDERRRQLPL
jgi:RNA polymerase sigma factor (sigma-70 family)